MVCQCVTSSDINQTNYQVGQDNGNSGVLWIAPDYASHRLKSSTPYYAGGKGQPPIQIIHDVVTAGYQMILNDQDNGDALQVDSNFLTQVFPDADSAARWVAHVVGDNTITTYPDGEKSNQPGVGLYATIQHQQQVILPKLQALVDGSQTLTVSNLQAISPPGMALSAAMIQRIQQQPTVTQQIIVSKLAQNISALQMIDQARLAIELLQTGETIPEVYSNDGAKQRIHRAVGTLQQQVNDLLLFIKARQLLMSNFLDTVIQSGNTEQRNNNAIAAPPVSSPIMAQGAVAQTDSQHSHSPQGV